MERKRLRDRAWYPLAVAGCITAALYVLLTRFHPVLDAIGKFVGFFSPVLLGCLIAYIVNPL